MRELHLAKSAGFCYGSAKAVELAESVAASGAPPSCWATSSITRTWWTGWPPWGCAR